MPRGGPFNCEYALAFGAAEPEESVVLADLLEAYRFSGYPGEFRLLRTGSVLHVVPAESRNALGLFEARSSLLETHISIEHRERTADETLKAITNAISARGAATIVPGTVSVNVFLSIRLYEGAKNELARSCCERLKGLTPSCHGGCCAIPRRPASAL